MHEQINGLFAAHFKFDSRIPEDNRTDAQIEQDAADHAQLVKERRMAAARAPYLYDESVWANVTDARLKRVSEFFKP